MIRWMHGPLPAEIIGWIKGVNERPLQELGWMVISAYDPRITVFTKEDHHVVVYRGRAKQSVIAKLLRLPGTCKVIVRGLNT